MYLNSIKTMKIHDSFLVKSLCQYWKKCSFSKWLNLCNLQELYTVFKDKHPDLKISFSKFASFRPKWCITVGPKDTHSVCVCTAHKNVKLLLSSVNLSKDYHHEVLELIVCDINSKECMIHCCESCSGVNAVKKYIEGELMKADDDGQVDDYDVVKSLSSSGPSVTGLNWSPAHFNLMNSLNSCVSN